MLMITNKHEKHTIELLTQLKLLYKDCSTKPLEEKSKLE